MKETYPMKCCECGRFVNLDNYDSRTPYGCADPSEPEPYDPEYLCAACSEKNYKECLERGTEMFNYWQKPDYQLRAMKELGLIERNYKLIKANP